MYSILPLLVKCTSYATRLEALQESGLYDIMIYAVGELDAIHHLNADDHVHRGILCAIINYHFHFH